MDSVEPTLAVSSIFKSFGRRPILRGVSLEVTSGRITALVGRNGVGKTTLLEIAAGLVAPDHGVVAYRGKHMMRPWLPRQARRGLFYLPAALGLPGRYRVGDLLRAAGRGRTGIAKKCADALGVEDCLSKRIRALSPGKRRRVEFAVAVARAPNCLLADEPFRALEPLAKRMVERTLRSLAGSGTAVSVTGHELDPLFGAADRVVLLAQGHTYPLGAPEAAIRDPRFRQAHLGVSDAPLAST